MRFLRFLALAQVLFAGSCFFINGSQAQDVPKSMLDGVKVMQMSPEELVNDMKDKLALSDDQAAQVLPIVTEQVALMKEVMGGISSKSIAPQDAFTRIQESQDKMDNALAQILTPEQMEKWRAIMHHGQEQANQMMQQGNFIPAPAQN